jgi:DNA-directed RNA polymerase subunit RPC12/RpoP
MEKTLSLKMEAEHNFLRETQTSFKCNGCNGTFQKPILATILSHGYANTYYACPRCLSKIGNVKQHKDEDEEDEKDEKTSVTIEKIKKVAVAKDEDAVTCKHFMGYLKKRSKDAPIPDECLTCGKMIECMVH